MKRKPIRMKDGGHCVGLQIASCALCLAVPQAVIAQPEGVIGFEATDCGVFPGDEWSRATSLSDDAWVALESHPYGPLGRAPCVWVNGSMTKLLAPPGFVDPTLAESRISPTIGILGGGMVSETDTTDRRAVVWVTGQGAYLLDRLTGTETCRARAANDRGVVAGSCQSPGTATVWKRSTQATALESVWYSYTTAINEAGYTVGQGEGLNGLRPVMWTPTGEQIDIGGEPEDLYGEALDINNFNEVVGVLGPTSCGLWRNGEIIALPEIGPCGYSVAQAINDRGWVVGESRFPDCDSGSGHAVLWWDDVNVLDLTTISIRNLHPGSYAREAYDINSAGQMVVDLKNVPEGHATILTPYNFNLSNPEPGIAGQVNTIQVTGLQPGQKVRLAAGFKSGAQRLPNSDCLGGLLLIQNLKGVLPPATADASGTATFIVNVPANASGQTLRMQAYDKDNCQISHSVDWEF